MPRITANRVEDKITRRNAQLVTVPFLRVVEDDKPRGRLKGWRQTDVRPREYLTPAEVDKLAAAAKARGRYAARDAFMIKFCARHAFRASELVNLVWAAIDLDGGSMTVNRLKNGRASIHYVEGWEIRMLRHLKRAAAGSRYVFNSERNAPMTRAGFQRIVERAGAAAGFDFPVHPHMLRHAAGYRLVNQGKDTRSLAGYLGHKNMIHTARYAELNAERFRDW